jgi:hypothetical protein
VADAQEIAPCIKTLPQNGKGQADFRWNIKSQECPDYPKSYVSVAPKQLVWRVAVTGVIIHAPYGFPFPLRCRGCTPEFQNARRLYLLIKIRAGVVYRPSKRLLLFQLLSFAQFLCFLSHRCLLVHRRFQAVAGIA